MLEFLKNYDKFEYATASKQRLVGGLVFEYFFGAVGAVISLPIAGIIYHFALLLI